MKTLKTILDENRNHDYGNPKSPGDKAFVDKHVIQKTDYPHKPKDGSNDDIFSGKKQKKKKKLADHPDEQAVYEMSDAQSNKMAQEDSVLESVINATEDKIITVENKEFKLTLEDANALKKIYEDLNDVNKKEFELKLQTKIGTQQLISFASQWGE